ncbi:MAG TPA: hypothetical protein PKA37_06635, partial [Planctomycetota bacterium]|nr:hypothetical protein [Planctomycetota bacterium]
MLAASLILALAVACGPARRESAADPAEPKVPASQQRNFGELAISLEGFVRRWTGENDPELMQIMREVFADDKNGETWAQVAELATSRDPSRYPAALAMVAKDAQKAQEHFMELLDREAEVDPGIAGTIILWASPTMEHALASGCRLLRAPSPYAQMTGHFVLAMAYRLERGPYPRPFSITANATKIPEDLWADLCAQPSPTPREALERAWLESFRRQASGEGTARTRELLGQMRFLSYMVVGHPQHHRAPTDSEESIRKYVAELNEVRWEHFQRIHHPKQLLPR